jgi:anionic cell wall polymer biosynthesis LytR-Cps2A-Psr (LCP) family protein
MAKKRKKKRGRKKIVLFVFEILVLIIVLAVLGLYNSTIGKIDFKNDLSASEAGINDDIDEESVQTMHGYLNVALFGLDNRSSGKYESGNSDCIMIASLNYDTNEVKLASLYRDTYLSVGKGKYYKANNAFEIGGAGKRLALGWFKDINCSKFILAGGLSSENLKELKNFNFFGVDVSSAVEKQKGVKDKQKMFDFVKAANEIS